MAQNDAMKVWRYPIGAQESNVCFWHKADMRGFGSLPCDDWRAEFLI
jgi:hypothetical protein